MHQHANGIVRAQSKDQKRVAVHTPYGYTIFDIENGEIYHSDEVYGYLDELGSQEILNLTTGQKLSVNIVAIQESANSVIPLLENA